MLGRKHDENHPSGLKLWSLTGGGGKTRRVGLENNCRETRFRLKKKIKPLTGRYLQWSGTKLFHVKFRVFLQLVFWRSVNRNSVCYTCYHF